MRAEQYVPPPKLDGAATDGLVSTSGAKGLNKRLQLTERQARMRVQAFKKFADRFRVPTTIAYLQSVRLSNDVKSQLDEYCIEKLQPQQHSRAFSAMYYDQNDCLLFCYMGNRWKEESVEVRFLFILSSNICDHIIISNALSNLWIINTRAAPCKTLKKVSKKESR
jgi:hypothetical protein